jgi:alcohol dehydrogenase (cytochrome c)
MKTNLTGRHVSVAAVLVTASLVTAACSSTPVTVTNPAAPKPLASGSWPYSNGDLSNTRNAAGSTITSANVSGLKQAWTFHITGPAAAGVGPDGALAANPIVVNGVVYIQDLDANVYALALATGRLKWEYELNTPMKTGPGPDGVAVAGGMVYGVSPTSVFALNARTGRKIWVNSHLLSKGQGTFEIQPQVADGRVYLASAYGSGPGGGVLLALSAASGELLWRFNTVLGSDQGVQAIGLGSGGAWETPLVSSDGSVTFGIGNPYQSVASAIAHPAAQLYTDSDVNLDAATGKLRWYYQGVPNDFMDHDMQALNLATGKVEWDTKVPDLPVGAATVSNDLVFTTLYHGVLIALNRSTGAIVFRRQLPTSANAPIAIAGNTLIVPAGGPATGKASGSGNPQVVAYTVPVK